MNLCKYVKSGTVVRVKIKERDMNKHSRIVQFNFEKSKNQERTEKNGKYHQH
jgi:hypothetical protein